MRSSFFGLHVTTSGMNTARASLHTISHNIANARTPGFSRQVAVQQAAGPLRGAPGRGMVGTGSQIISINQIRNQFLDTKFWSQNSVLGQFNKKFDILTLVQGILHEADGVGMNHDIDNVFSRMSELGSNAADHTYRVNFLSALETKAVSLNSQFQQLRQQQVDLNQEIAVTVGSINSLGRQITAINRQIMVLELDGSNANDLRDQRALLIDNLSRLVNIEVREVETNPDFAAGRTTDPRDSRRQLTILIDGVAFVSNLDMQQIEVRPRTTDDGDAIRRNPEELHTKYDVFWSNGRRFNMYSPTLRGELAGLIHLRDGNGGQFATFQGTPTFTPADPGIPGDPDNPPTPPTVRMQFAENSRVDMGTTGIININGVEFRYTNFELDLSVWPPTGIFELLPADNPTAGHFASADGITIGRTTSYLGIPYFMARLNEMARTVAAAFNEGRRLDGSDIPGVMGHIEGYDLEGNRGIGPGAFLLSFMDGNNFVNWGDPNFHYFNITADNFHVNPTLMRNPSLMRLTTDPGSLPSQPVVVQSWANIKTDRGLFREGRLGDFVAAITGDLGVVGRQAVNFARSYGELMVTIENQREAVRGVNLDEEVAQMIQHQMVFQAAARLFSVIDGIYDTMINRMGNW
ncbi:MAG: flagellar hook-associated protein FlgK [Clostridiales bacterium]|jgi:flagellar hook-associated protein 1 FlgK|nr:flagellar hook-associated protein FlgK [Clostridiales bacterium]